jgi:Protein of unknown function (DUF3037)
MERLCKFAVLRYVPDETREEFINIGLVFHSPEDGYVNLEITSNFSRVAAFDDEIDLKLLKLILKGVQSEFTQSTVHGPPIEEVKQWDFLEKHTAIYVNQLQFSPIQVIRSYDIAKDEADLFRTYVYFDTHKSKRITEDEVKSIMNRVFRKNKVFGKLNRNIEIEVGPEEFKLDYAYERKDSSKLIKTLSFDYSSRNSAKATQLAKEWVWNYTKLKEKRFTINNPFINKQNIEIVTLVYFSEINKNIKAAVDILKEVSDIIEANNEKTIEKFADEIANDISQ